ISSAAIAFVTPFSPPTTPVPGRVAGNPLGLRRRAAHLRQAHHAVAGRGRVRGAVLGQRRAEISAAEREDRGHGVDADILQDLDGPVGGDAEADPFGARRPGAPPAAPGRATLTAPTGGGANTRASCHGAAGFGIAGLDAA